ncbi:MAG: hypothetical protein CMI27_05390 [Opitutae bacterium]|nr:hypothetical protein [Opitutae bacterium]
MFVGEQKIGHRVIKPSVEVAIGKKFYQPRQRSRRHGSVASALPGSNVTKIIDLIVFYQLNVKEASLAKGEIKAVAA